MVRTYHGIRLVAEVICMIFLYSLIAVPLAIAAFTVSAYMGVPFVIVLMLGLVKRFKYNT